MMIWMLLTLVFSSGTPENKTQIPLLRPYADGGVPVYTEFSRQALYVTMRDGVRIAIDVYVPKAPEGTKFSTLIEQTRYWRASAEKGSTPQTPAFFAERGYAVVMVDVRGSGASFGDRQQLYSKAEIEDGREIVDWIIQQPWSNGTVGAFGVSYTGNTAALLAMHHHPAVRIVIPQYYDYDVYTDLIVPGGVKNQRMLKEWGQTVKYLDANKPSPGVAPVDGPEGKKLLKEAVAQHKNNVDVYAATKTLDFKDSGMGSPEATPEAMSLYPYQKELSQSPAWQYLWGSWQDAGTAQGVLHQLMTSSGQQLRAVIGPWNHGGLHHTSPHLEAAVQASPSPPDQRQHLLKTFDDVFKTQGRDFEKLPLLTYYTMGEERWHTTDVWPLPDLQDRTWYFDAAGTLTEQAPTGQTRSQYKVDFNASTGKRNRWASQFDGGDIIYPDRAKADSKLLTYTSAPLADATEITGWPVVALNLASSHEDGAIFVYLETVAPDGTVTYITEGQLRLVHRGESNSAKPYQMTIPYRTFREKDAQPMTPGKQESLAMSLFPTSTVIAQGHRLRIAIAGADKHTFSRYPAKGTPTLTFLHGGALPAKITLPTKLRKDLNTGDARDAKTYAGIYGQGDQQLLVQPENGMLVIRAKGVDALTWLDSNALNEDAAKPYVATFEKLLAALRRKDKPTAAELTVPGVRSRLVQAVDDLNRHSAYDVVGVWKERGLVRISFAYPMGDEVIYPCFLFMPDGQKLYYFYQDQPLPGGIRLMPSGVHQFRSLENEQMSVQFEANATGKAQALILQGKRFPRLAQASREGR